MFLAFRSCSFALVSIHPPTQCTQSPSLSPPFPSLLPSTPFLSFPLAFLPLNAAKGSGECCKFPQRVWVEPSQQKILVHCKPNKRHFVDYILTLLISTLYFKSVWILSTYCVKMPWKFFLPCRYILSLPSIFHMQSASPGMSVDAPAPLSWPSQLTLEAFILPCPWVLSNAPEKNKIISYVPVI